MTNKTLQTTVSSVSLKTDRGLNVQKACEKYPGAHRAPIVGYSINSLKDAHRRCNHRMIKDETYTAVSEPQTEGLDR
jgi:hypothetical protein